MKNFLKKIKLIDKLKIELEIDKRDFVNRLKNVVDDKETGLFSSFFEAFSNSKNEYVGKVNYDGFKIRKRRKFFDRQANLAIVNGRMKENGEKLEVSMEINGLVKFFLFFYGFFVLIFIFVVVPTFVINSPESIGFFLPIAILQLSFITFIPYFVMKKSTRNMKRNIERELFFLTKT